MRELRDGLTVSMYSPLTVFGGIFWVFYIEFGEVGGIAGEETYIDHQLWQYMFSKNGSAFIVVVSDFCLESFADPKPSKLPLALPHHVFDRALLTDGIYIVGICVQ